MIKYDKSEYVWSISQYMIMVSYWASNSSRLVNGKIISVICTYVGRKSEALSNPYPNRQCSALYDWNWKCFDRDLNLRPLELLNKCILLISRSSALTTRLSYRCWNMTHLRKCSIHNRLLVPMVGTNIHFHFFVMSQWLRGRLRVSSLEKLFLQQKWYIKGTKT